MNGHLVGFEDTPRRIERRDADAEARGRGHRRDEAAGHLLAPLRLLGKPQRPAIERELDDAREALDPVGQQRRKFPCGGLGIGDDEVDRVEPERAVGVVEQVWLPKDIARDVLDEDESRFGEFLPVDVHVAEFRTAGFLVPRAEGRVALERARRLHGQAGFLKFRVGRIRVPAADRDDVQPFVACHHVLHRTVHARVGQADDLEVAFAEHRAVVARAPGFDRRAGRARTAMQAPRRELEAEPRIGVASAVEAGDGNAAVVEFAFHCVSLSRKPLVSEGAMNQASPRFCTGTPLSSMSFAACARSANRTSTPAKQGSAPGRQP